MKFGHLLKDFASEEGEGGDDDRNFVSYKVR